MPSVLQEVSLLMSTRVSDALCVSGSFTADVHKSVSDALCVSGSFTADVHKSVSDALFQEVSLLMSTRVCLMPCFRKFHC